MHFHKRKEKKKSNIIIAKYRGVLLGFIMDCGFSSCALCFPCWYARLHFNLKGMIKVFLLKYGRETLKIMCKAC